MPDLSEIPDKTQFRTSEVCQLTDTQPYVLRFWESEFPQLSPQRGRGGQPIYRREDIGVVLRIKQLLYEEEYTIEGARRRLEQEIDGSAPSPVPDAPAEASSEMPRSRGGKGDDDGSRRRVPILAAAPAPDPDAVSRERYDDALDEIEHLRLKVRETESLLRKADSRVDKAERIAEGHRERAQRALDTLEKLLESLG